MSPQEIAAAWELMPDTPFRKLIQFEIERRLALERATLETKGREEFEKQQGVCVGLDIALKILARKDNPQKPR